MALVVFLLVDVLVLVFIYSSMCWSLTLVIVSSAYVSDCLSFDLRNSRCDRFCVFVVQRTTVMYMCVCMCVCVDRAH